jgi:hypothetical protein
MAAEQPQDAGMEYVKSLIEAHENFPIPTVLFQDSKSIAVSAAQA